MREEYKEKQAFIKALETAIKTDNRSYVKSIDYNYNADGFPKEIITITYKNDSKVRINAEINSNGANAKEIIAEIYGGGAHDWKKEYCGRRIKIDWKTALYVIAVGLFIIL